MTSSDKASAAAAAIAGPAAALCDSTSDSSKAACETVNSALQLLQEFLQVQEQRASVYSDFNAAFRGLLRNGKEHEFAVLTHKDITPKFQAASLQVIHIESRLRSPPVNRPDLAALLRGIQEQERIKLRLTLSWQALRATHARGQFSWQSAADRPCTAGTQQTDSRQQQQQQLMGLLEQMQLQAASSSHTDVQNPKIDQNGGFDVAASVKPGFYLQQMQQAAAQATAAGTSSSDLVEHHHHAQQSHGRPCCGHSHHAPPSDPLDSHNRLEPTEAEFNAALREAVREIDLCVSQINDLLEEVREAMCDLS